MSWIGRMWYGRASYAAEPNPYDARLGHVTVEAVRTFNSLLNTFSKTFDFRYDEAMRVDPQFALKMRLDPYLRSLLQERLMPLTRWKWVITPEDPTHKPEVERAKWYEEVIRATPRLSKQQLYLGHAAWYGRYASQFSLVRDRVRGKPCVRVGRHLPLNGDKLVFGWDGTPGVRINQSAVPEFPRENVTYDNRGGPILMLRDPEHRAQFIIHTHELDDADYSEPEMAGRIEGVGLRDFCYYGAYLRSKMVQWAVAFMEKVGTLGLLVFRYPEGNAEAKKQAELSAKQSNNRSAIAIPMPKGADKTTSSVELLPANMSGVQFLVDIIAGWWERHIERLFVGQSMSAGADDSSGLGGTGRAELAKDTKFNLLQFDATGQQESYTTDLLPTLFAANGDAGWKARFEYVLPDPEAEAKLGAITKAASIPGAKLKYKASEVRELVGMSEPGPDDETVGGEDPKPGPGGVPLPAAGGAPGSNGPPSGGAPSPAPGSPAPPPGPAPSSSGVNPTDQTPPTDPDDANDRGTEGEDNRWADPHPESEALVLAMTKAAQDGDEQALDDLADLASDRAAFGDLMADLDGDPPGPEEVAYLAHLATIPYGWTAGTSRSGGVVAIGNGPHSGKKLYGKQAEAALRGQQKRDNGPPEPTAKQRKQADADSLRRKKAGAGTAVRETLRKASGDPASLTPNELGDLAGLLKVLTVPQLKSFARSVDEKIGGKKGELADRLLAYVRDRELKPAQKPSPPRVTTAPVDYQQRDPSHPVAKAIVGDAKARAVLDAVYAHAARAKPLQEALDQRWESLRQKADAMSSVPRPGPYAPGKGWQQKRDAHKKAVQEWSAARLAVEQAESELSKAREAVRQELVRALAHSTRSAVKGSWHTSAPSAAFKPATQNAHTQKVVSDAEAFVAGVCANLGDMDVEYGTADGSTRGRAYAQRNGGGPGRHRVAFGTEPTASAGVVFELALKTQVHELGHVIEYHKPNVQQLANEFIDYRCDGETPTNLKAKFGGSYQPHEEGRKDDFDRAFGAGSAAYYVGKIYSFGTTEVISMGLEQLWADPARFIAADPEYAQFMFRILTM